MPDLRKLAEECIQLAQTATKPEDRAVLINIADRWLELASHKDKMAKFAAEVAGVK